MVIPHAKPADIIDIRPLGAALQNTQTRALVKTESLEVIWMVLPAGKEVKPHSVPGEITVQCLEGKVAFNVGESKCELTAGTMLYLEGSDEHSLRAIEDSSLLVTILLR